MLSHALMFFHLSQKCSNSGPISAQIFQQQCSASTCRLDLIQGTQWVDDSHSGSAASIVFTQDGLYCSSNPDEGFLKCRTFSNLQTFKPVKGKIFCVNFCYQKVKCKIPVVKFVLFLVIFVSVFLLCFFLFLFRL